MAEARELHPRDFIPEPQCNRQRFSKRKDHKRIDWCTWCSTLLKVKDQCPVEKARAILGESR